MLRSIRQLSQVKAQRTNQIRQFHNNVQQYGTSKKIRVMRSVSTDPFVNLATEDWIFNSVDPSQQILYLWRNEKTVVIGKHQNPWKECHIQKMEQDGVHLARRRSGGGAVYQDLGNTIFTFLSPAKKYDKTANFKILTDALEKRFGVYAELSGRNDIVVDGKKISGCAFKIGKDRAFHHGTLLVNIDTNALANYLNPNKLKLASKGITSVKSRVVNLKELNPEIGHESLTQAIMDQFFMHYGDRCEVEDVDLDVLQKDPEWAKYYQELKDWHWRFGQTPKFSHDFETRFDWGMVDVNIESEQNIIKDIKVFSDTLFPVIVEQFELHLRGARYSAEGVSEAASRVKQHIDDTAANEEARIIRGYVDEMAQWIANSL